VLEVEDMKIKDIYPVHQKINLVERTYKWNYNEITWLSYGRITNIIMWT
jgi:hypothetical protein